MSVDGLRMLGEDPVLGDLTGDLEEALHAGRAVHARVASKVAIERDGVLDARGNAHEVAAGEQVLLAAGRHAEPSFQAVDGLVRVLVGVRGDGRPLWSLGDRDADLAVALGAGQQLVRDLAEERVPRTLAGAQEVRRGGSGKGGVRPGAWLRIWPVHDVLHAELLLGGGELRE